MSTEHRFPVFVYPTLHCNFSCSYCFNLSGPTESAGSFLLDSWKTFLAECSKLRVPEIRLSGGEPLLISDIELRCRTILEFEMQYTLLTNGSLLERNLDWLSKYPPTTVWISYHREFSSVAAFRRRVERAAEVLPCVGVHVFSCDLEDDPEVVESAVRAGAQRIKILDLTPIGRCTNTGNTRQWSREKWAAMGEQWQTRSTKKLEVRVEAPSVAGSNYGASTCVLRERSLLSINHDGFVYPCCVTLGTRASAIGNLQYESFEEIVRRSASPSAELACAKLLPSIVSNKACCPLRLVPLVGL